MFHDRSPFIVLAAWALWMTLCGTMPLPAQSKPQADIIDVPAIADGLCVSNLFQSNMVLAARKADSRLGVGRRWGAGRGKVLR